MEAYTYNYLFVGIFILVGISFGLIAYILSFLLRPHRITSPESLTSYECGIIPEGDTHVTLNVRYLIYALLFVAFDVEAVFLFPWAIEAKVFGWYGFIEVMIFIAILLVGYFYAWGRGLLKWD